MDTSFYKVLIADDEYWTREKIRGMIDWEQYRLHFMEPAEDGEDVLRKIEAEMPDILITDINMPFINGVELLQIIKEKYPDIVTFVISGYNDFHYAKDSFMAGTINYLLKPVVKIDLVNALTKALEIISERKAFKQAEMEQQVKLLKAASFIQDREFSILIKNKEVPPAPTFHSDSQTDYMGLSLILVKIHRMEVLSERYQYDMNHLSYSVKKDMRQIINMEKLTIFNYIYCSNEFIILVKADEHRLEQMAYRLLDYFLPITQSPISIIISDHSYSSDTLHGAYVQTISSLMTRFYDESSIVLLPENKGEDYSLKNVSSRFSDEMEMQLKGLLKNGNQTAMKRMLLHTIGIKNCVTHKWRYIEVKQTMKRIFNVFVEYVSNTMDTKAIIDMENMVDYADKVTESFDVGVLCDVIEDAVEYVCVGNKEEATESVRSLVKQAVVFINENYFEALTLTSLAAQFHVESSYFSRMFRQETGDNLMLYITKKRLEKAKQYMKKPDINLTEIAFMVGYDDYTYFNRIFRKNTGLSPRDYRNKILEG